MQVEVEEHPVSYRGGKQQGQSEAEPEVGSEAALGTASSDRGRESPAAEAWESG